MKPAGSGAQARRDGYVGYVERAALAAPRAAASHRVAAVRAIVFAEPALKSRPVALLPLNAMLTAGERSGEMVSIDGLGWMFERQLAPAGRFASDFVTVAESLVGAPYLWGGRGGDGLDCSGLVQQALLACGRSCPRDSDQQQALGSPVDAAALARGDLVFWPGHVAIMIDAARIVHANAHHMAVAVEPLAQAIARIGAAPRACRRL
jgi:cell wall-associated NlpC family hydrolase